MAYKNSDGSRWPKPSEVFSLRLSWIGIDAVIRLMALSPTPIVFFLCPMFAILQALRE